MNYKLGEFLKSSRMESGESLRDFSDRLGISHTYLSTLEAGLHPRTKQAITPSTDTLIQLAQHFKMSLSEMFELAGRSYVQKGDRTYQLGTELEKLIRSTADSHGLDFDDFAQFFMARKGNGKSFKSYEFDVLADAYSAYKRNLDDLSEIMPKLSSDKQTNVVRYARDTLRMSDYMDSYSIASAGGGSFNDGSYVSYHKINFQDVPHHFDAQIDVHGDSMEPTIPDGAVAFIEFSVGKPPKSGDIYVFQRDDDTLIKRGNFHNNICILKSDNSKHDDILIEEFDRDSVRVIGKLVGWAEPT